MGSLGIPERIFIYWESGFDDAPSIVLTCVASWAKNHPDWQIVMLDKSSISEWVALGEKADWVWGRLSVQKRSDLFRLCLIHRHGGFWVDATLYSQTPIYEAFNSKGLQGLAGVRLPLSANRFISTFFLGAPSGDPLISVWLEALERTLSRGYREMTKGTQKRLRVKYPLLFSTRLGTTLWSIPIIQRTLGLPYLIPHYLLNRIVFLSREARSLLSMARLVNAGFVTKYASMPEGYSLFSADFRKGVAPFWKLTWRTESAPEFWAKTEKLLKKAGE